MRFGLHGPDGNPLAVARVENGHSSIEIGGTVSR